MSDNERSTFPLPGAYQGYAPGSTDEQVKAAFLCPWCQHIIEPGECEYVKALTLVQHCGHPVSAVTRNPDGTQYCRACGA